MRRMHHLLHLASVTLVATAAGVACADGTAPLRDGGVRVLFIGNSLTYENDLPRTIADMAKSVADSPFVYRMAAQPNYSLQDHFIDGIEGRIAGKGWHVVVMQQGPSTTLANQIHLSAWSEELDKYVSAAGARTALYEVAPGGTSPAAFAAVRDAYRNAALNVDGMFIPAAEAFLGAWAQDPGLVLYQDDQFHPSRLGTYLIALVHFEMLYDRPATDLPDIAIVDGRTLDVPAATVALLQQVAHEAVVAWGIP
jgi:hypothetical protein